MDNKTQDSDSNYVIKKINEDKVDFVNFWFTDIFGELHSVGIPAYSLTEDNFRNGFDKLDASSIRGFNPVNKSDLLLLPDISTYKLLPPYYDKQGRTNARMFVDIYNGSICDEARYSRDSRSILKNTKNNFL